MSADPNLAIGPMDVDSSAGLTRTLGVHNKAHLLLRRVQADHPEQLTTQLAKPPDLERTDVLRGEPNEGVGDGLFEEIEEALRGLRGRRAFFKEDDELIDASVRGVGRNRVIAVLFRKPSGRTARGVLAYDSVPGVEEAFQAWKAEKEGREAPAAAPGASVDEAAIAKLVQDAERVVQEAEKSRIAAEEEAQQLREQLEVALDPEPWDGYADATAEEIKARLAESGPADFGRLGLENILAYEESHKDRSTVKAAVQEALVATPPASE